MLSAPLGDRGDHPSGNRNRINEQRENEDFDRTEITFICPDNTQNHCQICLNIVNSMYCLKGGLLCFVVPSGRSGSVAAVVNYV